MPRMLRIIKSNYIGHNTAPPKDQLWATKKEINDFSQIVSQFWANGIELLVVLSEETLRGVAQVLRTISSIYSN